MTVGVHSVVADRVGASIEAQREADKTLEDVRGGASTPDVLHVAAMRVWAAYGSPGLVAFHRRLQKAVERAAP